MPRGVYERKKAGESNKVQANRCDLRTGQQPERKKTSEQLPPPAPVAPGGGTDKKEIGLLALRGYLAAIMLSGGAVDGRDVERMGAIIDEALNDENADRE